ncbi:MAG: hypothetical protein IJ538_03025 [Clostridia bacterium]|nr:hypothetical protein [Clostridia bacterium]
MALLVICRQIRKIEIVNGVAVISGENDSVYEIESDEKYNLEITKFFRDRNLGFKIQKRTSIEQKIEELKKYLGDKLKVE